MGLLIFGARDVAIEVLFDRIMSVMRTEFEIIGDILVIGARIAGGREILCIDIQRIRGEFRTWQIVDGAYGPQVDLQSGRRRCVVGQVPSGKSASANVDASCGTAEPIFRRKRHECNFRSPFF